MEFSELEFLGQIASFECRLRGAVPTPLTLPYPFHTSTSTRMEAERDKREVRIFLYFERYSWVILRILKYGEVDKMKLGKTLLPNRRNILSQNKYIYCKTESPWYRGRYDSIVGLHFVIEFRYEGTYVRG